MTSDVSSSQIELTMLVTFIVIAGSLWLIPAFPNPFSSNLAYRSPFESHPQFARDTNEIHSRLFKRQIPQEEQIANTFDDEHYPTFYSGDFSNVRHNSGIFFLLDNDKLGTFRLLWRCDVHPFRGVRRSFLDFCPSLDPRRTKSTRSFRFDTRLPVIHSIFVIIPQSSD